jgi:hypothetical protein
VPRIIFGPKGEEITGEWRRLHNEYLRNLYTSPNIIRVVKSRSMRWEVNVARMGQMKNVYRSKNLNCRDHSEDVRSIWGIILEWILGRF